MTYQPLWVILCQNDHRGRRIENLFNHSLENVVATFSKGISWKENNSVTGLVWFYGISTIVGYLMPDPLSTYILKK